MKELVSPLMSTTRFRFGPLASRFFQILLPGKNVENFTVSQTFTAHCDLIFLLCTIFLWKFGSWLRRIFVRLSIYSSPPIQIWPRPRNLDGVRVTYTVWSREFSKFDGSNFDQKRIIFNIFVYYIQTLHHRGCAVFCPLIFKICSAAPLFSPCIRFVFNIFNTLLRLYSRPAFIFVDVFYGKYCGLHKISYVWEWKRWK